MRLPFLEFISISVLIVSRTLNFPFHYHTLNYSLHIFYIFRSYCNCTFSIPLSTGSDDFSFSETIELSKATAVFVRIHDQSQFTRSQVDLIEQNVLQS